MTILLIRHAESVGNADETVYRDIPDHNIALTEKGQAQAVACGEFVQDWYQNNPPAGKVRLWASPHLRTTQTAMGIRAGAPDLQWDHCSRGNDIHFDERLREREWGLHNWHEYKNTSVMQEYDPDYHKWYWRVRQSPQGRFYARPFAGESAADVSTRLRSFFHDLYFDIDRGIKDHLIVLHAMTMLAFVYAFTKLHPALMDNEALGGNTAVRLLDTDPQTQRYADYGFIYNPADNLYTLNKPGAPVARDLAAVLPA